MRRVSCRRPGAGAQRRSGYRGIGGGAPAPVNLGVDLFTAGTFTRSSSKIVQSDAQTLTTFATNVRAIENRGDGLGDMLNLEGAATSRARNSGPDSTGTGWTTASATVTFAAQDGPLGPMTAGQVALTANATSRVVGTNTNLPTDNFNVAAAIWLRGAVGGEVVRLTWRDKAGTVFYGSDITLSTAWQRYSVSFNALSGANTLQFGVANAASAPVAKTVYFAASFMDWGPVAQSVQGPSSYIAVDVAQTTRALDLLTLALGTDIPSNFFTDGFEFDFALDVSSDDMLAISATTDIRVAAADARNYLRFTVQTGDVGLRLVQGNLTRVSMAGITWSRGQLMTVRVEPAFARLTLSGATTGNGTLSGTANTGWGEASATSMVVGASHTGSVPAFGRYGRFLRPVV